MGKKIPLLISTLIASSVFSPIGVTSAVVQDKGTTWWSVLELLDYYPEAEAERVATCGDDFECNMNFEFDNLENSDKYRALNSLLNSQLRITSINPETETIKVLFFDDDMMLRHMGIEEKLELENLYIGWTESWLGHGYYHNFDAPFDDSMPGVHQLFNSEVEDITSIIPWQETELPMLDSNISNNTTGVLYFTIYAKDNMFNAQGSVSYANCLSSPDYQEGMECKMYVSGSQGVSYFPTREPVATETGPFVLLNNSESEPTTEPETNIEDAPVIATEPDTTEPDTFRETTTDETADKPNTTLSETPEDSEKTTKIGNEESSNFSAQPVKAPETGISTATNGDATEFPWWLGAIFALGGLTLLWFFLPIRPKNPKILQKKPEKSKKSIDKISQLR